LNDYNEMKYFIDLYNKIAANDKDLHCISMSDITEEILNRNKEFYVFSASSNPDSLTLWSNYCEHEGYNIGFDWRTLSNINPSHSIAANCGEVIYDKNVQISIIEIIVKQVKSFIKEYQKNENRALFVDRRDDCIALLKYCSVFFKDELWRDENECRIVVERDSSLQNKEIEYFRKTSKSIVPYIKLPLNNRETNYGIKLISIGAKTGLQLYEDFLSSVSLEKVLICKSKITIR